MVTISLCMIVKDEEALLPRCLESIQGLVEEVIVVDTGSSDRTMELAQQAGAQVYTSPGWGDISQARNFSFSKATQQVLPVDGRRRRAGTPSTAPASSS